MCGFGFLCAMDRWCQAASNPDESKDPPPHPSPCSRSSRWRLPPNQLFPHWPWAQAELKVPVRFRLCALRIHKALGERRSRAQLGASWAQARSELLLREDEKRQHLLLRRTVLGVCLPRRGPLGIANINLTRRPQSKKRCPTDPGQLGDLSALWRSRLPAFELRGCWLRRVLATC